MAAVSYDVSYTEKRNRLTSAFRYILAIPLLLVAGVWGYAAQIVAFLQWFVILFTGRRNEGMWNFQRSYLGFDARVTSYASLLFDAPYPNFGGAWAGEPVAFGLDNDPEANRLTNALRLIWIIPALIIAFVLSIALAFVLLATWLVIIITGRQPRGMFDFIVRFNRFSFNINAYGMLMTDTYPRWEGSEPTGVLPPGDRSAAALPGVGQPAAGGPLLPPPSGPPVG